MDFETNETIKRLWQRFWRDELGKLSAEERAAIESQFEQRFEYLLESSADSGGNGFIDLIGFGAEGVKQFGEVPYPHLKADFDAAVIPSQLHAAAELYFCWQYEQNKIFAVIDVLQRLFELGRMRVQRGPGARGLYLLEKWKPLRYSQRDRMIAYRRVFNYGRAPAPAGAVVNKNFNYQFVALMTALAQYFRDLTIGEVIRGSGTLEQRPYGNIATVQRLGTDLRYAIDRATYGNIFALTHEVGDYLKKCLELLDSPDIRKSFDANNKWDVIEMVANRHLGGAAEISQRAKMAESGRRVLYWVADNDFRTTVDPVAFQAEARPIGQHAEAWIAAYRMTQEGRRFPGVSRSLRWAVGLPDRYNQMAS
jgi:hypothetical protein